MNNNNQYDIELLIKYYQGAIMLNDTFPNLYNEEANNQYGRLVTQLTAIRQAIIEKDLIILNELYEPLQEVFINEEHFSILEEVIIFYKRNPDTNYDVVAAKQYLNNHL